MMKLKVKHIISLFILINIHALYSYDVDNMIINAGINFNALTNYHKVDFVELPGIPNCCVKYNNMTNTGFNSNIFAEMRVFDYVYFRLNLGYSSIGGNLQSDEFIGNTEVNGELIHVVTSHNLESEINLLNINPVVSFKYENLSLNTGFLSGIMIEKTYYQHEDLTDDDVNKGIQFYDGNNYSGTSRNISNGDLPEALLYHCLTLGLSYDISISKRVFLRPEVTYLYNLKNLVTTKYWRVNSLSYGLSLAYKLKNTEIPETTLEDIAINKDLKEGIIERDTLQIQNLNNNSLPEDDCSCYIIFGSSKDEQEAQEILNSLIEAHNKLFIQEWVNPYTGVKYYRVRSECYNNYNHALKEKNKTKLDNTAVNLLTVVKCN
jgi:hypothetical protein